MTDPREGLRERVEAKVRDILDYERTFPMQSDPVSIAKRIHAIYAPHLRAPADDGEDWRLAIDTTLDQIVVRTGLGCEKDFESVVAAIKSLQAPLTDEERERDVLERGAVEVGMTEGGDVYAARLKPDKRYGTGDTIAEAIADLAKRLSETEGGEG